MDEQACVYIMASSRNGTLYLGSTVNLAKRVWEHRNGVVEGFTKKYGCRILVWYEIVGSREAARQRELQMKEWKRAWKLREIEGLNRTGTTCMIASLYHDRFPNWAPAFAGVVGTEIR